MKIREINGNVAKAVLSGTERLVYLAVLDEEAQVGDHVIIQAGFAIHKIDEKEAGETMDLFEGVGFLTSGSETDTDHGVH